MNNQINNHEPSKIQKFRNRIYTPIKLFNTYIILTYFISIFGPWNYIGYNKIYVGLYLMMFLTFSTFTYVYFVNKKRKSNSLISKSDKVYKKNESGLWIAKKSILVSIVLLSFMLAINISSYGMPAFNNIFRIMAQAYTYKNIMARSFNLSAWLFNYFSIFYVVAVVLGTYYFKKIGKIYKFLYFLVIILYASYNIIYVGNQKAFGDLLIYLSSVLFIKFSQSGKIIKIKTLLNGASGLVISFFLFSNIIQSRMIFWNVEYYSVGNRAFLDINHWMLSLFGNIKLGAGTFLYYLSSGYYGLSLSLQLPFKWSYGLGGSFEMRNIVSKLFPLTDSFVNTYPVRVERIIGWDAYVNWHTVFPWLASDLTFLGAVVFICLFIAIYAICWSKILKKGHWINIMMFVQINIMLIFVPANNQLFQTRASLIVTTLIIIIWIFNHNKTGEEL